MIGKVRALSEILHAVQDRRRRLGKDFGLESGSTSTLDEDLITDLKNDYTIAIVTHNMQQAARVSDYTAYMYLGDMVEMGETDQIFTNPAQKATEDYITGRYG